MREVVDHARRIADADLTVPIILASDGQTAVRAMWFEKGRVAASTFDEIAGLLLRCRDRLQALLDEAGHAPAS